MEDNTKPDVSATPVKKGAFTMFYKTETKNMHTLPNHLFKFYFFLREMSNHAKRSIYPSQQFIADALNIDVRSVQRNEVALEEFGFITKEMKGNKRYICFEDITPDMRVQGTRHPCPNNPTPVSKVPDMGVKKNTPKNEPLTLVQPSEEPLAKQAEQESYPEVLTIKEQEREPMSKAEENERIDVYENFYKKVGKVGDDWEELRRRNKGLSNGR
jgi:hypothetical protein